MNLGILAISLGAVAALGHVAAGADAPLAPRAALAMSANPSRPAHPSRLIVKFHDDLNVRPDAGALRSRAGADLAPVTALARAHGATFAPLIHLPEATLRGIEQRAAARSGRAQPDLAGLFVVHAPARRLEALAAALAARAEVEFVSFAATAPPPPCDDLAPFTPEYESLQSYRGPAPGLGIDAAWAMGAARGAGVRIADVEYAYTLGHEDLCGITPEADQTFHPDALALGYNEHGAATLGMLASIENAYGCLGLVPDADMLFFTEWSAEEGVRRETAIARAIESVEAGDIIMLEMQTLGDGGGFGPAELEPAVWLLTRTAVDAGIIVVAAAGNGAQDLDGPAYETWRGWGDSGAIIVGAGSADLEHRKLSFSTFGSRVNLQGWGELVFTLGYGDYADLGDDDNQRYTDDFSGTSSAVPFVVASCAAVQGLHEQRTGTRLDPETLRARLMATGAPQQGGTGSIGPFPDIIAAAMFCAADLDGDGAVNMVDLLALLASWGAGESAADIAPPGGDGVVDGGDLAVLLDSWGSCEP